MARGDECAFTIEMKVNVIFILYLCVKQIKSKISLPFLCLNPQLSVAEKIIEGSGWQPEKKVDEDLRGVCRCACFVQRAFRYQNKDNVT